jgi:hypothetical protein
MIANTGTAPHPPHLEMIRGGADIDSSPLTVDRP